MTIDNPMRVDPEPSSSQFSVLECDPPPSSAHVRWSHSNPESLLLKQQLKDGPVQPQPDVLLHSRTCISGNRSSSLDLVNPLPSDHPAKAKRFELRQEDSPSMPHHIDEFHSAIDKMNGKIQRNARQKAHKDRRDFSRFGLDSSVSNLANKSDPVGNPLRREHSFQGASFPPDRPSRLQARASEPDITTLRASGGNDLGTPSLDPSRHISHPILDTLRKVMDIDWDNIPSNTPTPSYRRRRNRSRVDSGSFKYNNDSETSSSPSSTMSPLVNQQHLHSPLYSPGDEVPMTDQGSPVHPPHDSPLTPNEFFPMPDQPSLELPSPLTLMPPPPPPSSARLDPPARLMQPAPAPASAPTQTLLPSSLSRPSSFHSQAHPTQTQSAHPRTSQRPRPLGMCRAPGQSSISAGVKKPYKRPLAVRAKKPAPAPHRPERYLEAVGDPNTLLSDGGDDRRSMSPIIPDPPHVAARAQMLGSQSPVLEMSARRPEPMDDGDEDIKDANSSADLWACFE